MPVRCLLVVHKHETHAARAQNTSSPTLERSPNMTLGCRHTALMVLVRLLSVQSFRTANRFRRPLFYFSTTTTGIQQNAAADKPRIDTSLHGGAPQRSARARKREKSGGPSEIATTSLEWESFDFSNSPKWDDRFGGGEDSLMHLASNTEDWKDIEERETKEDVALQQRFDRQHQVWNNLDIEMIDDATNILLPYVNQERWDRIQDILSKRTQQTRFLFENPANPSNVWACLRTLDSFGIQHVDVVIQSGRYKGKAALTQKRGMRTAMGSAKWLTLKNHLNTKQALKKMKEEGYHIVCTDVNPTSKDIRDMDWDASGKKLCVVMGNEQYGISDEVKEMADESFYLPMVGMAESFNLSVATAITCAHLSAASGQEVGKGPLRSGDLSVYEYKTLLLKGLLNTIKPKTSAALFRKNGLAFPKELNVS